MEGRSSIKTRSGGREDGEGKKGRSRREGWKGEKKEGTGVLTLMRGDGVGIKRPASSGGWGRIKRSTNVGRHREEMRPQSAAEQPKLSPTGR